MDEQEAIAFLEAQRLKAAAEMANLPPTPEPPKDAKQVIFVNHAGIDEKAVVLSMNGQLATLQIQGKHVNDKYKRANVPKGGDGEPLTYHEIPKGA
jgi:hypothetical protein